MKKSFSDLATIGVLCALYFFAGKLGLSLAVVHPSATAVWPPTGIALAAVLLLGQRVWPGILLGAFLVNVTTAGSIATSLGIATGNTLEALFGALLARRFAKGWSAFDRANDVVKFVVLAGMASTIISATFGVTSLCLGGFARWENYFFIWATWWLGDLTSNLVVAPLLLVWSATPLPRWQPRSTIDAVFLLLLVFVVGQMVFGGWILSDIKYYPLSFLCILPLLLSALRFGQHGAVTATAAMSASAIWGTVHGFGPFALADPNESLFLLQAFLATVAVTTLVLASVLSERKAVEDRVRQSEERFRSMIENVKDHAIFMLDPEGRVLTWNKGAERNGGYREDEIIGKPYSVLFPVEDQVAGRAEQLLRTALTEGQCEEEGWRSRKDGSKFWASVIITVVRDEGGKLSGFSNVTSDLTRRRRNEEELTLAKEQAEAANEAKSAFLANISHEIRTPMTGVIGMSGLLYDTELTDKQREYCEIIRRSSEALLTIINEVLDFSKVEVGKLELEIIDFDLRSAVEEVTALFAQQAADKGVELIAFMRYDVPANLRGDPGRLRQILSNLVGNALKFTAEGEVAIRVNVVEQDQVYATLRFEVSDTGIGIAGEKVDKLFTAFAQADASITRKYGGTGLGLALCKKFVDLMGGQIGVKSEVGRGSTFWFTLQLSKGQESRRAIPLPRIALHGLRMLIVEGNATNRSVLEHYLGSLGILSQSATNGPAALELLRACSDNGEPYDLGILDCLLPGMNGIELARAIRQDPRFSSLKLLLLTSVGDRGDGALAQQVGFDGYLTKPVGLSHLSDCLAVLTGKAQKNEIPGMLVTRHTLAELKEQRRLRILVADDNHINQKVVTSLLENMGHRADVVGNGKEAVQAFEFIPYDIVLMDIQMPEMDGFEAALQIRTHARMKDRRTSIIAITAHAVNGFKEECMRAGFDDYISKPILPRELRAAIVRSTGKARANGSFQSSGQLDSEGDVLDIADALARVEGNQGLLGEITQLFLDQYPKLLVEIDQALSSSDSDRLTSAVHTLGSSAGQVGAKRVFAIAREIEEMGQQNDLTRVPAALAKLKGELALVESALVDSGFRLLSQNESPSPLAQDKHL